jgi:Fe-S-cluster containining protein
MLPGDLQLVQIVDAATAEAAAKAGSWLACRPGCTQCCIGVFAISQLDAARLQAGLRQVAVTDPARAAAVRERARASVSRLTPGFPGDPLSGILGEDDPAFEELFEGFANDEPCPSLDPQTGLCDLYAARPMTCRTFGPPMITEGGLAVCELCFVGAPPQEVQRCAVSLEEAAALEADLTRAAEAGAGQSGSTLVAFALGR